MLPGLDGFEVLRQVRRRSAVPIIMLTARTEKADRIAGLDAGADDYLPKPFDPEELTARIRAVLRRAGRARSARVRTRSRSTVSSSLPGTREVWADGKPIELTTIEFDILDLIARSAGRVVSRHELTAAIHQRPVSPLDRSLDVHVSHIRKKLGRHGEQIRTVRGVGYLFRAELLESSESPLMKIQGTVDLHKDRGLGRRHGGDFAGWLRRDLGVRFRADFRPERRLAAPRA